MYHPPPRVPIGGSGSDAVPLNGGLPRTPYAAVAYARSWRERGGLRAAVAAVLVVGAALVALRGVAPSSAAGDALATPLWRGSGGGGAGLAPGPPRHVLVLDSGSSGTRIYAFTWRAPLSPDGLPALAAIPPAAAAARVPRRLARGAYDRVETQPGLAAYAGGAAGLEERALAPLLDWARAVVPRREWAATPLLLLATGGLRRLPAGAREAVLARARAVLAASGFDFRPPWARVISGTEEAVYGWVALNYERGSLGATPARGGSGVDGGVRSSGALDLGGSSLEVAFELPAPPAGGAAPAWSAGIVNVSLAGATHTLHSHVFHAYGLNEAFDRGVALLLADAGADGTAAAPAVDWPAPGSDAPEAQARPAAAGVQQPGRQQQQELPAPAVTAAGVAEEAGAPAGLSSGTGSVDSSGATHSRRGLLLSSPAPAQRGRADPDWWDSAPRLAGPPQRQQAGGSARRAARRRLQRRRVAGGVDGVDGVSEVLPRVRHPCLHEGYDAPYHRLPAQGGAPASPPAVRLLGAPDFAACSALARRLVNPDAPCPGGHPAPGSACVLGALHPRLEGGFTAITGFFVVSSFLRLPPGAAPSELLPASERLCALPWSRVREDAGGAQNAERYCTWGPYVAALLRDGLGLEAVDSGGGGGGGGNGGGGARLAFGHGDMGWPLGAALVEVTRLPGFMPREGSESAGAPPQQHVGGLATSPLSGGGSANGAWSAARPWALLALALAAVAAAWLVGSRTGGGRVLKVRPSSVGNLPVYFAPTGAGAGAGEGKLRALVQ
ncbi:hypothetical protein Rsub_08987 [Raphidocelis subcapitata]|uniref:Apyrase n=1 Tax=Raphidocelis subcapitata TaxID=307507 RepID=A0A2V0P8B8_9CHLO|nr:hypothetical protein Rsub_08987 [Raphidocelis subcapitata]|eukprot:GBF96111.1 hypothetical protein Rsub_08987 [Raphidocelis subcapitata]